MDKTVAGLLGAVGALAGMAPGAQAAPLDYAAALQASSYADLLKPIPNAAALWRASAQTDPGSVPEAAPEGGVQEVQYHDHHHHHHHQYHRYHRRHRHVVVVAPEGGPYAHHHHHHHHHAAVVVVPPQQ